VARIKAESFVVLEETIAAVLGQGVTEPLQEAIEGIYRSLDKGDFLAAREAINSLDLKDVVSETNEELEELAISSLLFGASNATNDLNKVSYLAKDKPLPDEITSALNQLDMAFKNNVSEQLRRELHKVLDAAEEEVKQALFKGEIIKADTRTVSEKLNDAVLKGKSMIDLQANLTTSRLVSFGFLAEAVEQGMTTYQISEELDSRTCALCAEMHGRTFNVAYEYSKVRSSMLTTDPNELKNIAPWPKNTKAEVTRIKGTQSDNLQNEGYGSPPFHPFCRGILVTVGQASEMITDYTLEDFPADWEVFIEDMKPWNENMRISPQRFKNSMLYGLTPELVSVEIYGSDLFFDASLGGASKIIRNFDFKNKIVSHEYFKLADQGAGTAKRVMLNQVALYRELDFKEITMHANIDVGGYAWAKYGFVPTPESWRKLHIHILQKLKQLEAEIPNFPQNLRNDIIEILASNDPKSLWTIADLKDTINGQSIAKLLLLGSDWYGTMDLLDSETTERFIKYVK